MKMFKKWGITTLILMITLLSGILLTTLFDNTSLLPENPEENTDAGKVTCYALLENYNNKGWTVSGFGAGGQVDSQNNSNNITWGSSKEITWIASPYIWGKPYAGYYVKSIRQTGNTLSSGTAYHYSSDWTTTYGLTTDTGYTRTVDKVGAGTAQYGVIFARNEATISYNGNGNTGGSTANSTAYYGVTNRLNRNGFTKTGYRFSNWTQTYFSGNGTTTVTVVSGGTVPWSQLSNLVGANCTTSARFNANWTPNTYKLSYNLNGGTFGTYHPADAEYDNSFQISNPTRAGYIFDGWTASGINTSYAKYGTSYSSINTSWTSGSTKTKATYFNNLTPTNNATVTLTANWTPITYHVCVDEGWGNGGCLDVTYDEVFSLTLPTATGYTFAGWTATDDFIAGTAMHGTTSNPTTSWTDGAIKVKSTYFKNLTVIENGLVTLIANWNDVAAPVVHRATWQQNGTTGYYAYAYVTDNEGVSRVQFPTWTDKNGQDDIQASWGTSSSASGTKGSWTVNGQTYNYRYEVKVSEHNNEYGMYHTHIYAYDAAGNAGSTALDNIRFSFTVTLNPNGGSGGQTNVTATYDSAMPTLTSLPTREGWKFLGYYDAQTGGTQYYTETGASARVWNKAANTTLYAHWQERTWLDYIADDYAGGNGTEENPFQIATAEQLALLAYQCTVEENGFAETHFIQTADIDLNAHQWYNIGSDGTVPFCGIYDGNLYQIKNIRMERVDVYQGLFGVAIYATIKNVHIVGANISNESGYEAGGIIGDAQHSSIINCIAESVTINGDGEYAGGIAGFLSNCVVRNCMVKNSTIISSYAAGGIAGAITGSIQDCNVINTTITGSNFDIIAGEDSIIGAGCYGSGTVNGTATKLMYGDANAWGNWSLVSNINGGLPVQKGLYHIGGFTSSQEVYDYLTGQGYTVQ